MDIIKVENFNEFKEGFTTISTPVNVDMGIITDTPYKLEVIVFTPNYKEIDASIYCSNSSSLPESNIIDNNYVKLKPTWCFYDKNLNKVYENIKIDYHTELVNEDGELIGAKGDLEFYFRDDLPSKFGFPTMLHVSLNIFNYKNKNESISNEYVEKNYYNTKFKIIFPLPVLELVPSFIRFTTNGILDFSPIQYPNVELKSYVTINGTPRAKYIKNESCGESFPIMYNYPKFDSDGNTNVLSFKLDPLINNEVEYPDGTSEEFPIYTIDKKNVSGGWIDVSAIPKVITDNARFSGEVELKIETTGMVSTDKGDSNWVKQFDNNKIFGFKTPILDTSNQDVVDFIDTYAEYITSNVVSDPVNIKYYADIDPLNPNAAYPTTAEEYVLQNDNAVGGILVDDYNNIWVSHFDHNYLYVVSPSGDLLWSFDVDAYGSAHNFPIGKFQGSKYAPNKITKNYTGTISLSLYNSNYSIEFNYGDGENYSVNAHYYTSDFIQYNNKSIGTLGFHKLENKSYLAVARKYTPGEYSDAAYGFYYYVWNYQYGFWSMRMYASSYADYGDYDIAIDNDGHCDDFLTVLSSYSSYIAYRDDIGFKYMDVDISISLFSPLDVNYIRYLKVPMVQTKGPLRCFLVPNSSQVIIVLPHAIVKTKDIIGSETIGNNRLSSDEYEIYKPSFVDDYVLSAWIDDKMTLNVIYGHMENDKLVSSGHYRGRISKNLNISDVSFSKLELGEGDRVYSFSNNPYSSVGGYDYSMPISDTKTLKGTSTSFSIENFEDSKYDLRNVNESWDMYKQYMSYIKQEYLLEFKALWEDFMKHILGTDDSSYQTIGRQFYDKISNFVLYNSDVSTGNVKQLGSLLASLALSVRISTEDMPATLEYWMNKLSVQFTKLMGEDINCDRNFVFPKYEHSQPCPACGKIHKSNMGNKIDNPVLEIGTPIVIRDTYNSITPFELFYPNVSGDIKQLEYFGFNAPFESNYEVYEYVSSPSTPSQSEGLLNRYDEHNTLDVKTIDYYEWWKDWGHVDKIYYNILYDGFGLDKGEYTTEVASGSIIKNKICGDDIYLVNDANAINVGIIPFKMDTDSTSTRYFVKLYKISTFYPDAITFNSLDILNDDIDSSSNPKLYGIPINENSTRMTTLYKRIPDTSYVLNIMKDGLYICGNTINNNDEHYTSDGFIIFNYDNSTYGIPLYV